jgi:hypothetical protein
VVPIIVPCATGGIGRHSEQALRTVASVSLRALSRFSLDAWHLRPILHFSGHTIVVTQRPILQAQDYSGLSLSRIADALRV